MTSLELEFPSFPFEQKKKQKKQKNKKQKPPSYRR